MKNQLWDTLQEVEEVKVSFEQTVKKINNIQQRYKMVTALKKKATKRQESFEEEIQAAITETQIPSLPKKSIVKKNKIRLVTKKRVKKSKKSPLTIPPRISISENVLEMEEPFVCLQTNCVYEVHETTTHLVTRKPYGALIRRLYQSAKGMVREEVSYNQEQDRNLNQDQEVYPDFKNSFCSCSFCCLECR
ncbi:uncharacterized protein [Drosophila takahashii]|uniref:uncharacterized protein n=1 Tax=Drosophila takahashii TaxID=29030 RepID=UPI001CF842CE|nr:uncharacterized protein LOC108057787 [Drosophila takahashii]